MGNVNHPPPGPVVDAPIIPDGTTAAMIAKLWQQYNNNKRAYKTYYAVDAALKSQLLQATSNDRFVATLKHAANGFALVWTRTIIPDLYTTYSCITSKMLAVNDDNMRQSWDPTSPIKILFTHINLGQAYVMAGNGPYTDIQVVQFAYTNVAATNCMELACPDW
jgi:hypothetical protein